MGISRGKRRSAAPAVATLRWIVIVGPVLYRGKSGQRFYLLPTLTARENVELPMRAARRPAGLTGNITLTSNSSPYGFAFVR